MVPNWYGIDIVATAEQLAEIRSRKGYAGRKKGQTNKITKDLKAVYLKAFDKLGGLQGLVDWGETNPDLFYSQISKLLPKGLEIKSDQELTINIISNIPEPLPLPAEYARVVDSVTVKALPAPEDAPGSKVKD